MNLRRASPPPRLISLVSMIDVLLILLVFFMVTSSYLDLNMIPLHQTQDTAEPAQSTAEAGAPFLIRLGADGETYVRGQPLSGTDLSARLSTLSADTRVMVLPSLHATTQSLVGVMDLVTGAGLAQIRVVQVAAP